VDIRGRGLMSALEFGGRDGSLHAEPGTAAKLVKAANERGLLILAAGAHFASQCSAVDVSRGVSHKVLC